ncbi:MAG: silent information regulator protein Sir2 [Phycisphaerae bacterium]|jgi:rhamnogalacturonan endolyase|nr:silent information regulator protein Sir2 [Phycisphaerae bacterium]
MKLRSFVGLFAFAFAALPSLSAAEGDLKIDNADFEAGKGSAVARWGWWSRTKVGSAGWTDREHHSGKGSVCIRHDGQRDWAFSSETKFAVAPGRAFRVSAWVKVASGHVTLAVVARGKGKLISWDIGSVDRGPVDRWTLIRAPVETPDGCDQIYVRFVGDGKTLIWVDDVAIESWKPAPVKPREKVKGYAKTRVVERLDRGLNALPVGTKQVYLSWRLLADDPRDIAFNVYRRTDSTRPVLLSKAPVNKTTDFMDKLAPAGKVSEYFVRPVVAGKEAASSGLVRVQPGEPTGYSTIKLKGDYTFQKVGLADLDRDGRMDFVIKQPHDNIDPWYKYWKRSPNTYKLEAYRANGDFLWRYDMGWAIERGIWYSPYVVWDFDGDGKAEVAVKSGQGDPRDAGGKVRSGPEYLTILDGLTGKARTRVDWPDRKLFTGSRGYNYASRNQLGVAYLDGKTPCLIVERGTYNLIIVTAYEFHADKLRELWTWSNKREPRKYWGQGAHWMHAADVDRDGRDEIVIGSAVIDDNGSSLWSTGLGHPDHCYVSDLDPKRPGLEIYYGIEPRRASNAMCMVDAATGRLLWGHDKPTTHIHSSGLVSDIDPRYPGAECYSGERDLKDKRWIHSSKGKVLAMKDLGGLAPRGAYWDADPQRELIRSGRIEKYGGERLGKLPGRLVAIADILGDWREELVVSVAGQMRIYSTTIRATDRRVCLMQDPIYRIDVAHAAMGYMQVPMLSYDMASGGR